MRRSLGVVFERFTDRARRVVVSAQEEVRLLQRNYIGTEHVHEPDSAPLRGGALNRQCRILDSPTYFPYGLSAWIS